MHTNPLLREARSSPYIGASAPASAARTAGVPPECSATATGASLHAAVSEQHFERLKELVKFSTGCTSSTSLIAGLQFCTDEADTDTLRKWAQICEERKAKAESVSDLTAVEAAELVGEVLLDNSRHPETTESCVSIASVAATAGSASPTLVETTNLLSAGKQHCSETNLSGHQQEGWKHRDNGFKVLEKCCSVELSPAKVMIPPSRLARTKEMPNIADVDDNEGISEE